MFKKVEIDLTVQYAKRKITFGFARLPLTKQFLQQFHCKIVYMASPKLIRLEFEVYGKVQGNVLFSYFFPGKRLGTVESQQILVLRFDTKNNQVFPFIYRCIFS